jgi:hypothetical protein
MILNEHIVKIMQIIIYSLRPGNNVNLTFRGKISVGVKLSIYPYSIILETKK